MAVVSRRSSPPKSGELTDSDGRRMPYAQFVQTVSRKWVLDAQAAESLAKQDLTRAMLEVESLEARAAEGEARASAAEAAREDAREESAAATARVDARSKRYPRSGMDDDEDDTNQDADDNNKKDSLITTVSLTMDPPKIEE